MKQQVLGVGIDITSYDEVCSRCGAWIDLARAGDRQAHYVCITSVHGIMTARRDPAFREILNAADIATPDGMPVVWAMRSLGSHGQGRVYGPTLMLSLSQFAEARHYKVFLYGASNGTLAKLAENLLARFPDLLIAGRYAPPYRPLTPKEDRDIVSKLRESKADIVFVGLSTPKQEAWMSAHKAGLPGVVMLGVGAAFDFHAGRVSQAPAWMQRNGLEWFYRLLMEPRRLWRRYLIETPMFLPLWFLQLVRQEIHHAR
ncbi:MAG TPA: WecB/TagA/CpsF family glycosyltransferase [Bryobacteraceae bacterium]|nr:WecB/TagA/CpsF family glycosyltransferase [Bryobacteraceae bacterium]